MNVCVSYALTFFRHMTWKHPQAETRVAEGTFYMYKQSMLEMKKDINVGLVYMHKDSQVKSKGLSVRLVLLCT